MRVFKDMKMVEYLGSGIPRILKSYDKSNFEFGSNYIRLVFPYAEGYAMAAQPGSGPESRPESGPESRIESKTSYNILKALKNHNFSRSELAKMLGHESISGAVNRSIKELLEKGFIEYTLPDKPNSRLQKYRLTAKGRSQAAIGRNQ